MAVRENVEQILSGNAGSENTALPVRPSSAVITERSPITGIFNTAIFLSTLLFSLAAIIAVAVATPFVVLLAAIAEFFDKDGSASGWTTEKVSQNAR